MLPGFRFLFAAILLSASILVFGLGAAALLRATHEQYVSTPWRNGPQEQMFAQGPEPAQPVLAALRAEPEAAASEPAPSLRDQVPTIALPASEPEQVTAVTSEAEAQPEVIAMAPAAEPAPPVTEAPALEPARSEVAAAPPASADTLTPADTTTTPTPAMSATDVPRNATAALASRVADIAAARVAALNDLASAKTKADSTTPDSKPRARKAKKRHRIVRRLPPPPVQQALDPFGQQQMLTATTATRTR